MITIHVPAMTARQDVRVISARISDIPGVQTLKADLATGTVQVKGVVALAAVTAAVTAAGYAVTSATDDPPASAACHRPWLFGRGDHGRPPRAWVAPTHLRAGRNGPKPARPGEVMTGSPNDLGTHTWVERTGGLLTAAERRSLLRPLASAQVINVVGRLSMLVGVNTGRRAVVPAGRLRPPDSVLTRAAEAEALRRLTPALLNHSYRTFAFGSALGALENLDVDREVLFAAALLHDVGLPTPVEGVDFTRASARVARDVAEDVGLSTAATNTMRTAITLHHSPGVTSAHGPVAYLLSAGAGLDVVGVGSWRLPPGVIDAVIAEHPRLGFKREFAAAFRMEAARVPRGRVAFLRRHGAFDLAVKAAPFRG